MASLILVVFAVVPLLYAFARTTSAGLELVKASFAKRRSGVVRGMGFLATVAAITATAIPLVLIVLPSLPEFSTVGDGGIGMAYNTIAKLTVVLMIPALVCLVAGWLLHAVLSHRSTPTEPTENVSDFPQR